MCTKPVLYEIGIYHVHMYIYSVPSCFFSQYMSKQKQTATIYCSQVFECRLSCAGTVCLLSFRFIMYCDNLALVSVCAKSWGVAGIGLGTYTCRDFDSWLVVVLISFVGGSCLGLSFDRIYVKYMCLGWVSFELEKHTCSCSSSIRLRFVCRLAPVSRICFEHKVILNHWYIMLRNMLYQHTIRSKSLNHMKI